MRIFAPATLVVNRGHRELLLPAMALVVGLYFLPIAHAVPFRPLYLLGHRCWLRLHSI